MVFYIQERSPLKMYLMLNNFYLLIKERFNLIFTDLLNILIYLTGYLCKAGQASIGQVL